tara:strand:+ start:535 stop:1335 length:801 start_codon:yes stop_codon:yes gene_type:complete
MDNRKAREQLQNLRDSITEVLGQKSSVVNSSDIKEDIKQAQKSAREGTKQLKKSLLERVKDLPVVSQASNLGVAGSVAVSTAAVAQTDLAVNRTELFVAEVAQDVIDERFIVPDFIGNVIDFEQLNTWGKAVIAEKISEVSEQPSTVSESSVSQDTTPSSESSSDSSPDDTASDQQESNTEEKSEKSEKSEQKTESSEDTKEGDSESESQDKQEQNQEQETETSQESQDSNESSEQPTESSEPVKTAVEQPVDEIKPHSFVVSPTS